MEIAVAAAITSVPPLLLAIWRDLRNRTNGQGPLGVEQKAQGERLGRIELHLRDSLQWQVNHLTDHNHRN
jgi:hypothetical protein